MLDTDHINKWTPYRPPFPHLSLYSVTSVATVMVIKREYDYDSSLLLIFHYMPITLRINSKIIIARNTLTDLAPCYSPPSFSTPHFHALPSSHIGPPCCSWTHKAYWVVLELFSCVIHFTSFIHSDVIASERPSLMRLPNNTHPSSYLIVYYVLIVGFLSVPHTRI